MAIWHETAQYDDEMTDTFRKVSPLETLSEDVAALREQKRLAAIQQLIKEDAERPQFYAKQREVAVEKRNLYQSKAEAALLAGNVSKAEYCSSQVTRFEKDIARWTWNDSKFTYDENRKNLNK